MRALAAQRWANNRAAVLQGQRPSTQHMAQLQAIDHQLRMVCVYSTNSSFPNVGRKSPDLKAFKLDSVHPIPCFPRGITLETDCPAIAMMLMGLKEVAAITDAQVQSMLRAADTAHGKWIDEDPTLDAILQQLLLRP
jgi:hypothetical protein